MWSCNMLHRIEHYSISCNTAQHVACNFISTHTQCNMLHATCCMQQSCTVYGGLKIPRDSVKYFKILDLRFEDFLLILRFQVGFQAERTRFQGVADPSDTALYTVIIAPVGRKTTMKIIQPIRTQTKFPDRPYNKKNK